jgi:hypothetical protein
MFKIYIASIHLSRCVCKFTCILRINAGIDDDLNDNTVCLRSGRSVEAFPQSPPSTY